MVSTVTMHVRLGAAQQLFVTLIAAMFLAGVTPVISQQSPSDLVPRVDTLWTRLTIKDDIMSYEACDVGGSPKVMLTIGRWYAVRDLIKILAIDPNSGDTIQSFESGHRYDRYYQGENITGLRFASRANVFITSEYGLIKVWRWPEMTVVREFTIPKGQPTGGVLTSDGLRLFTMHGYMFDVETGDTLWHVHGGELEPQSTNVNVSISADDRFVLTVRSSWRTNIDMAYVLDASTGTILGSYGNYSGGRKITSADLSDDGRYVAVSIPPTDQNYPAKSSGVCVVYDRSVDKVKRAWYLNGDRNDGSVVNFGPNASGIILHRVADSIPGGYYFYNLNSDSPSVRWAWGFFSGRTSPDYEYQFDCEKGSAIWLGRVDWTTVSAVDNQHLDNHPKLQPHPVDDVLRLSDLDHEDGLLNAEISNAGSELIIRTSVAIAQGSCTLHVTSLPPGTYSLRLTNDQRVIASMLFSKR